MVGAGIAAGAACFLATALWRAPDGPRFAVLSAIAWGAPGTWFDAVLFGLAFPALPFGLWKARRAEVRERRRYRLFVAGLAIGFLPMAAQVLAEAMVPAYGAFMDVPPRRLIVGSDPLSASAVDSGEHDIRGRRAPRPRREAARQEGGPVRAGPLHHGDARRHSRRGARGALVRQSRTSRSARW